MAAPSEPEAPSVEDDLAALRRRADEHASTLRNTQLALHQLAESVGQVVATQRRRERAMTLNSFAAYALFTVLLGAAFFWLYRARVAELAVPARPAASAADPKLAADLAAATQTIATRADADREAYRLWEIGAAGDRVALAAGLAAAGSRHTFTPTEQAALARLAEGGEPSTAPAATPTPVGERGTLDDGIDAQRAGDHARAIALLAPLAATAGHPDAGAASYYLGLAHAQAGNDRAAISAMRDALAADVKRLGLVDTRYQLAVLHEKVGDLERARVAYDRFATENPQHPQAMTARRRSAAIARPGGAGGAPDPATP